MRTYVYPLQLSRPSMPVCSASPSVITAAILANNAVMYCKEQPQDLSREIAGKLTGPTAGAGARGCVALELIAEEWDQGIDIVEDMGPGRLDVV